MTVYVLRLLDCWITTTYLTAMHDTSFPPPSSLSPLPPLPSRPSSSASTHQSSVISHQLSVPPPLTTHASARALHPASVPAAKIVSTPCASQERPTPARSLSTEYRPPPRLLSTSWADLLCIIFRHRHRVLLPYSPRPHLAHARHHPHPPHPPQPSIDTDTDNDTKTKIKTQHDTTQSCT